MANQEQVEILKQGAKVWNEWRINNRGVKIDLRSADLSDAYLDGVSLEEADLSSAQFAYARISGANLSGADLSYANFKNAFLKKTNFDEAKFSSVCFEGANLEECNLTKADLSWGKFSRANLFRAVLPGANLFAAILNRANLQKINLEGADLRRADLYEANLQGANLIRASLSSANFKGAIMRELSLRGTDLQYSSFIGNDLTRSDLSETNLSYVNLTKADLTGANLTQTILVETTIEQTIFKDCQIYGLSAWGLKGIPLDQSNLVITKRYEPKITVDDLRIGQFIHLLLDNKNVRNVIDTITAKAVLILGRFTEERKAVLDAISDELRIRNYLPIVFDFSGPENRDITETVSTLAHMARFIIADISDPRSIPQELMLIVPTLPSVPVQPLLLASQDEYAMFSFFRSFPWFLNTYQYEDTDTLLASIEAKVIQPAEDWLAAKRKK